MSITKKHRDLSQLSALLAGHSKPVKVVQAPVAKLVAPANDNKPPRERLAWPAFERLAYRGDHARLFALRHWRDLCFPRDMEIHEDDQQYEPEVTIEIRPSEAELLSAVGRKVTGRERWNHTGEMANTYDDAPAPTIKYNKLQNSAFEASIGNLTFRDGELKQWGTTANGRPLRPDERRRGAKGGSKPERTDRDIWSYIRLKGAVSPLAAQPYSKPCFAQLRDRCTPSAEAASARQLLEDFGIDGSVPFDKLPFPAVRCSDGLVSGPQWVGGVKQPKPTVSEPAGTEPEFVRHVETVNYVDRLRLKLGDHARVLDLAISDATAVEIGVAMGLAPAYAAKRGATLVEYAIDKLIEIDETARGDFMGIARKIAA